VTELRPVGAVRSVVRERGGMPSWGAPARVEVFPAFADALYRVEKHTHLWVLAWLDMGAPERELLQVKPRGRKQEGDEALHGVFAVRSPARPNPIGLTAARVLAREGLTLHFDRLDFLDGTPVLDLKPYFPSRDGIYAAWSEGVGKPPSRQALREGLIIQAAHFLGAMTEEAALAVRIVEHYRATRCDLQDPPAWRVAAPLHRGELVDALMGMTRVSLGRGTLGLHAGETVTLNDAAYALQPFRGNPLEAEKHALFEAPAAENP
jgi:tRNA-Thr(GGU) m(6)t(6)A37 methyltransferase TsaA